MRARLDKKKKCVVLTFDKGDDPRLRKGFRIEMSFEDFMLFTFKTIRKIAKSHVM